MSENLLDTHPFIWFINGDKELSNKARELIEADASVNFISIASIWEIAIKISLGKLQLNTSFEEINKQIEVNGLHLLPTTFDHTLQLSKLPFHHRDPFDRMIIAQSIVNRLTLVSRDNNFKAYGISVFW
jgi:PIN domain nuclease of toxin-antitoxin system